MVSQVHNSGRASGTAAVLRHDPQSLDAVFATLRDNVERGVVPTASLAIGDADGAIRSEAFGGRRRPITTDDYFFLASVTKPIFATAFMQLVEEGQVGLDDPIAKWLPEFDTDGKRQVTARQLLTHTSGVPDYPLDRLARDRPSSERMTQATLTAPLQYEPGTRYEYNSATYLLLAAVIERLTGVPYREFLNERVLVPLGMDATFDPRGARRTIVPVEGVGVDNRIIRFLMLRYLAAAALPGGGLFGKLDDLIRFGAALLRPRRIDGRMTPISSETFELMAEDQLHGVPGLYDGEERPVHHGLGWGKPTLMHDLPGSPRVVSHGGASGTRLWIDPQAGLVFVYFTNRWAADRAAESDALIGTYEAIART